MTPKEKAAELVDRFLNIKLNDTRPRDLSFGHAKQCALICVDENLKLAKYIGGKYNDWSKWNELKEVKKELNKL